MVLDPFTAIGLAGNIVQFVDYSSKLISSTHEIYRSSTGSSRDHDHLEGIATRLLELSRSLEQPKPFGTESYEKAIHELRKECILDAESLLKLIKALKARKESKWSSFRQAVCSAAKKNEISRLERRLSDHQSGLATQVIAMLSDQSSIIIHTLKSMAEENRHMDIQRTDQLQESKYADRLSNFDNLQETLSDLACTGHEILAEQAILKSLRFREIRIRFEQIPEAYTATLQWVLKPSSPGHPINFIDWLEDPSQSQPYWIGGKPGSGKSTLMKFIHEHPTMKASLRRWAGSDTLITASFFFWLYGTEMQKSQEGLLKTLLYEILRQCPNLIQTCLPHRYGSSLQHPWTRSELLEAFITLKHGLTTSTKFCIFIDGLDEFQGEPRDLLPVIRDLADSPNFKVCVSSRPWQIFIDEFDRDSRYRLYLQDLTRPDIEAYVRYNFEKDRNFQQARKEDPGYEHLVNEIVARAQGVWLWVALVTKSLLNGFTYGDSLKDLERRLQHLPVDLEEFFQHILDSVEPVYQTQMAQTFLIALAAKNDLPLLVYSFLDDIREEPNYALNSNGVSGSTDTRSAVQRMTQMRKRLDARSKGLLEVSKGSQKSGGSWIEDRVEFLHRTVADFLNKKEIKASFVQKSGPNFDPDSSLCHGFLALCKSISPPPIWDIGGALEASIHDFLHYAYTYETKRSVAQAEVIDELERCLGDMRGAITEMRVTDSGQRLEALDTMRLPPMASESHSIFELCVQHGVYIYVEQRLRHDSSIISSRKCHRPILSNALFPVEMLSKYHPIDPTSMVQLLLEHGADPNTADGVDVHSTTWSNFIRNMVESPTNLKRQLMDMLLNSGAYSTSAFIITLGAPMPENSHAKANRIWMLDKLLEKGIDPNSKYRDSTVWQEYLTVSLARERHEAGFQQTRFKQVELLLLGGADPDVIASGRKVDEIIQEIFDGFFLAELLDLLKQMRLRKEGGLLTRIWHAAWGIFG
ncbi:hypothetical protein V8E51_006289 [Hyaloscypha variabilis]